MGSKSGIDLLLHVGKLVQAVPFCKKHVRTVIFHSVDDAYEYIFMIID